MRANMTILPIATVLAVALCAAVPAGAADKADLVRVDKSDRRLELLRKGTVLRSYRVALGNAPEGHKREEGDERTPEGRYVLDWRNPGSSFHKSIHISYPNAADRAAAKAAGRDPGGLIMIHGQPNGFGWWSWLLQLVDWTDGCIAVTDAEMDEIWTMVDNGTPIEITP
ncbi:MAG: L,D-transpeptidase family protein [Rhizobiaceae bacterium]|nr:L,D-transpeptidase family protein [Rhizobiaceae bacterium]